MSHRHLLRFLHYTSNFRNKQVGIFRMSVLLCHSIAESQEGTLPPEWYKKASPKVRKLGNLLRNVDLVDGKLVNISDNSTIFYDRAEQKMHTFQSLVRVFLGSYSVQQKLKKDVMELSAGAKCTSFSIFSKPEERQPMVLNSLTKVSSYLNISAQQRKQVRLTICPQVTQERIWIATLEETLKELRIDLDSFDHICPSSNTKMGQQIVSSCLNFLADASISCEPDSTSWMRLSSTKAVDASASPKWEELLEMFNDLINCLKRDDVLALHVKKLEYMKEGLSQIKDVLADKSIGYKEARHQECLVQKKLSKTLGHSSQCLFTLLLYYLYGRVRDIEVDINGGIYGNEADNRFGLYMGKILTSDEEKMVQRGVKQLDRALGLFKFIWDTAGMKGLLELRGYLWCVDAEDRTLKYKGNTFFLRGISP